MMKLSHSTPTNHHHHHHRLYHHKQTAINLSEGKKWPLHYFQEEHVSPQHCIHNMPEYNETHILLCLLIHRLLHAECSHIIANDGSK